MRRTISVHVSYGRGLATMGFSHRFVMIAPRPSDRRLSTPVIRVCRGSSKSTDVAIQNQPPFPRNVIAFQNGVHISERRFSCIHNKIEMSIS